MVLVLYLSILLNEKQQKKMIITKIKINFFFLNFKVSATESDF